MKIAHWFLCLSLLCWMLASCQNAPAIHRPQASPASSGSLVSDPAKQSVLKKMREKSAYLGPLKIQLDQSLLKPGTEAPVQNLTQILNRPDFHIQALPEGPLAFQETFVADPHAHEIKETFRASDTERYTLHVQTYGQIDQFDVFLNGIHWLKKSDFAQENEALREGLLLQANNSLLLQFKGNPGASVTVSVVKGGEAGTVLRRRGKLGLPGATQTTHTLRHDINIFDPHDPMSLGGLIPYQGDIEVQDAGSSPLKISGLKINGGPAMRFESGVMILKFANPETGLEVMRTHYGAQVLEELEGFYTLRLDLSASPIERIVDLIHGFNQHSDANIESVSFSSLAAMQNYVIALDVLQRFPGLLQSLDFNQIGLPAIAFNDSSVIHTNSGPLTTAVALNDCHGKPVESWWLTETHADKAWELSIGTGVKVAWLDTGYEFPSRDIDVRRVRFGLGDKNVSTGHMSFDTPVFKPGTDPSYVACATYHSLCAMVSGFGERDNGIQTAGVAPNSTVVPYKVWTSGDFANAIWQANDNKVDVIGINYGWQKTNLGQAFAYNFFELVGIFTGNSMRTQIRNALQQNRPVVMAAHNFHESLENWMLVDLVDDANSELRDMIVVGAVTPSKPDTITQVPCPPKPSVPPGAPSPAPPPLGMYGTYNPLPINWSGAGSNYGPNMVWAPGDEIYLANRPGASPDRIRFGGTSAATPFVAAVVAQIKSRNPDLNPDEIKKILLDSKAQPVVGNPGMQNYRAVGTGARLEPYLLDVEQALSDARVWKGSTPRKAESFYGLVTANKTIRLNPFVLSSAGQDLKVKSLEDTVSQSVWNTQLKDGNYVRISGWSSIQAGEKFIGSDRIETLKVEPICPGGNCALSSWFDPQITNIVSAVGSAKDGFELELAGQHLIAHLQDSKASERFKIRFKPASGSEIVIPIPQTSVLSINNDGTGVKLKIPGNTNSSGASSGTGIASGVPYQIQIEGAGKASQWYNYSSVGFSIASQGSSGANNCEQWSIRAYNVDDTATAYVNLNNVTTVSFNGDSGFIPIDSQLHPGRNQIRFILFNNIAGYTWGFQIKKNNDIVYDNKAGTPNVAGANGDDQTKPNQIVFDDTVYLTVDESGCGSINGLLGTVYNNSYLTPPEYSKKYFTMLDYVDKNKIGDQFGIGLIDYFSIRFDGKLTLPSGYPAGEYTLILGHDDGAKLDFSGTRLVDSFYETNYYEHSGVVQLSPGVSYPIKIEYQELNGEAELGLFWIKPDGTREYVPAEALSH